MIPTGEIRFWRKYRKFEPGQTVTKHFVQRLQLFLTIKLLKSWRSFTGMYDQLVNLLTDNISKFNLICY